MVVLEPAAQALVDATSKPPFLNQLTPDEARTVAERAQQASLSDHKGVVSKVVPLDDFSLKIVRPAKEVNAVLPVLLYIHGGGWVIHNTKTFSRVLAELATEANVAVVAVEYNLSPEAKFPHALEQVQKAFAYIEQHAADLNLDTDRLVIGGDSAGGNMAAVTSMSIGKEKLRGQVLFYPVAEHDFDTGSYKDFGEGYYLSKDVMKWFFQQYLDGVDFNEKDWRISPLRAPTDVLARSPPTLLITAEADVLRDAGEELGRSLVKAGVPVTARFNGIVHDFILLDALKDTGAATGALLLASAKIRAWTA